LDFLGWKIIKNKETKTAIKDKEYNYLLQLRQGQIINYKKITAKVTLKNNKMHYTEAKLVQLLVQLGTQLMALTPRLKSLLVLKPQ
jgi:DNA topoisomerase IA